MLIGIAFIVECGPAYFALVCCYSTYYSNVCINVIVYAKTKFQLNLWLMPERL